MFMTGNRNVKSQTTFGQMLNFQVSLVRSKVDRTALRVEKKHENKHQGLHRIINI